MPTKQARKTPQNTTSAGRKSLPAAAVPHQWKPGQSGNPGGRAKGLSAIVRERTKDGLLLFDELASIARNPDDDKRFDALKLLAAYGFGMPGTASVEWDEARVKEAAVALGKDPEQMVANWRLLRGEKAG